MLIEQDPSLGLTTLWIESREYGTGEFNDTVSRLQSNAASGNKLVIYISGSESLAKRTSALLTDHLARERGA
ncbi:MAG: hypothetical protein IJM75_04535 [Ruminococcus sp.]|nr:hypothetical protein [Ruminococcus sp.]